MTEPAAASVLFTRVGTMLETSLRSLDEDDRFATRERLAREALFEMFRRLAAAHRAHHDPVWTAADLVAAVRREIERHTFDAAPAHAGVLLLDDRAARYAEIDDLAIVGLVEQDWPEVPRRNIFYPPSLLNALGWPSERDRRAAEDAHFLDLAASPRRRVLLSTFMLDEEAIVSRSLQLDELSRAGLGIEEPVSAAAREPPDVGGARRAASAEWAAIRAAAPAAAAPAFHGHVGSRPPRVWSVSAIESYLDCPFKFFARHVLQLDDESLDEEGMTPRQQGVVVHRVFEQFFRRWQDRGNRTITSERLADARGLFVEVVDEVLSQLPDAEARLERTRLLGSPAAAGLGEAVFRMEAERPAGVVERWLETTLDGELPAAASSRAIMVRGKADRIDLLDDGTFRIVDYKLGWPPDRGRALQLPIYGLRAEAKLERYRGRDWVLGEAVYLAFKGPRRVVPLFSNPAQRAEVMARATERLADALAGIDRGEFPPRPDDVFRCETCEYAPVCRKDHV
jgi:RecB family exonuclease